MASPPIFPPGDVYRIDLLADPDPCNPCNRAGRAVGKDWRFEVYEIPAAARASGLNWQVEKASNALLEQDRLHPIIAFDTRVFDRFTLYGSSLTPTQSAPLPPSILFNVRMGFGKVTSLRLSVVLTPPTWGDADLLFIVSGVNYTRVEVWAGTVDGGVGRPAQDLSAMTFDALFDTSGCCESTNVIGPWGPP